MTIALARPLPATTVATPTLHCTCGGYLAIVTRINLRKNGRLHRDALDHVDTCTDCLPDRPAPCALADLHHTCTTPTPVACAHLWCTDDAAVGADHLCARALDACCGCCRADA